MTAYPERDKLLSALDAFQKDRELGTQGKAIRVLVTEMLTQLGYMKSNIENGASPEVSV